MPRRVVGADADNLVVLRSPSKFGASPRPASGSPGARSRAPRRLLGRARRGRSRASTSTSPRRRWQRRRGPSARASTPRRRRLARRAAARAARQARRSDVGVHYRCLVTEQADELAARLARARRRRPRARARARAPSRRCCGSSRRCPSSAARSSRGDARARRAASLSRRGERREPDRRRACKRARASRPWRGWSTPAWWRSACRGRAPATASRSSSAASSRDGLAPATALGVRFAIAASMLGGAAARARRRAAAPAPRVPRCSRSARSATRPVDALLPQPPARHRSDEHPALLRLSRARLRHRLARAARAPPVPAHLARARPVGHRVGARRDGGRAARRRAARRSPSRSVRRSCSRCTSSQASASGPASTR